MLSKRATDIKSSPTMAVAAKAKQMVSQGIDVINFGVGEPDFNTPDYIKEAGKKAIDDNFTRYTPAPGMPELKKAIAKKFKVQNNLDFESDQIIVSPGGKASLFYLIFTICDAGDKIIVPAPYWVTYPAQIELSQGIPVVLETKQENDFKIEIDELKSLVAKEGKVKAIIINSPSNPTGAVYSKDELKAIGDFCVENNILIISDEIYEELVYEGKHVSIAECSDEIKKITIVVNGASKAYAMTGWRLGYTAGPKEIVAKMGSIQSQVSSNVNSISQKAFVTALEVKTDDIEKMKTEFATRRKFMIAEFNEIDGVKCSMPTGAFYAFPDISAYLGTKVKDDLEFCNYMLENFHIAIVPGSAFGAPGCVRFSYANSMENLVEGIKRFKEGLKSL